MKKALSVIILAALLLGTMIPSLAEAKYISVDSQAILPDVSEYMQEYPATLIRGEIAYDWTTMLENLLGENYETMPVTEYSLQQSYESRDASKPYRYVYIDSVSNTLDYHDAMITGEREGEYQPSNMNMLYDESLVLCKSLLTDLVDSEWLEHPGIARQISERWNHFEDRWSTDSEYAESLRNASLHYFVFEHQTETGLSILDDNLTAAVGVNGLDTMMLTWHNFITDETTATPISLEDAIAMADTTRQSPTVLLYAQLVYSNWLTGNDEYNLSWYLVTSEGNYVVDCIQNKHMCDMYEY